MKEYYNITLGQTNCYLLPVEEGYLLIDCGRAGDEHALISRLKRLGISLSSIKYLFLTHHHGDHSGLLHFLITKNPDLRVILSRSCAEYLENGQNHTPPEEQYANDSIFHAFKFLDKVGLKLPKTFPPYKIRSNDIIIEEDFCSLLPIKGKDLLVLSTPGHTDDSITLIQREDAFVGDTARNVLQFIGSPYEPIILYNHDACYDSWKKIITLGIKYIHPSHGNTFPAKQLETKLYEKYSVG
ncbi:MAG TPA: MBL fold metallo-hydrolase [Mobilitalea sp.]|nr:MBL fold metallo-hydrolase [Mobilitalea sp.]